MCLPVFNYFPLLQYSIKVPTMKKQEIKVMWEKRKTQRKSLGNVESTCNFNQQPRRKKRRGIEASVRSAIYACYYVVSLYADRLSHAR